ncbi:hypothetical protein F2Q69_00054374 [Brassica cretica]|uniref:2-oxoadipate dioxygenase/decarboxylase n=1 Tax=Brassica cretica TaxID=69181 RepID=A0A8S9MZL7_BRACR|nr:hypothetical protein F2Q69_00054374 [Brassica cretica]
MAVMGYENLSLIVAETRWPSSEIDCEVDETLLYSEMFLKGLLAHLRSGGGTKMVVVEERKRIGGGFEFSGNGGGGKGRRLVEVFGWVLGGGGDALSVGDECGGGTKEKHNLYLDSLENSSVKQGVQSNITLVEGYGIESLSSFFMDYGYKAEGGLDFPTKKLRVLTFSPPDIYVPDDGHGLGNGPLPRLVIAELLVDELSSESKEIIRKYLKPKGGKQAVLSSTLGSLIWEKPISTDFQQLAKESDFAAWVLIHGYMMNHLAFSVHRLKHQFSDIKCIKEYLEEKGFELNNDGGILKVSQDGLLLQVSSISEKIAFEFADGVTETIPASYIEFTQRLVLPEFKDLPHNQGQNWNAS